MSITAVRAALETALMGMSPAIDTVFQDGLFTLASGSPYKGDYQPVAGTPYQLAYLLPARPDNSEIGPNYLEQGIFQVTLRYPLMAGTKPAGDRAELIRTTFKRGLPFVSGGVTVTSTKTPEIQSAQPEADRHILIVRVTYAASITA